MDMKGRKSKRSSKAASPARIPVDAKTAAGPSTALAEADGQTHPGGEFITAVEEEKAAGPSAAPAGADRRTHPRYGPIAFSGCPRGHMVNQETGGARSTLSA